MWTTRTKFPESPCQRNAPKEKMTKQATIIQNTHTSYGRTITIDGKAAIVLKADVERVIPNPRVIRTNSAVKGTPPAGKSVDRLSLATSTCWVRILTAERRLIYVTSGFIPPDAVASIDTKKKTLHTISGTRVPAGIRVARLSLEESIWAQNAMKNAEIELLAQTLETLCGRFLQIRFARESRRLPGVRCHHGAGE